MEPIPATTHVTARASADLGTACVFSGSLTNEAIGGMYEKQVHSCRSLELLLQGLYTQHAARRTSCKPGIVLLATLAYNACSGGIHWLRQPTKHPLLAALADPAHLTHRWHYLPPMIDAILGFLLYLLRLPSGLWVAPVGQLVCCSC